MDKIKCDTHTHTLYSRHAFSTIEENVRAAAEQGLELLASTDHFSAMLYPEIDIKHYQYIFNQSMLPRNWHGVALLRGCEADIVDLEGHLFGFDVPVPCNIVGMEYQNVRDLYWHVTERLDYVIASIHGKQFTEGASLGQTTDMMVKVLENPKVLILGHLGRSAVPFDLDTVLLEAKARGKLIELNEHSFSMNGTACKERCQKIAIRCGELGTMISLGTDAHVSFDVGKFEQTTELLEEIHFPKELIASRDKESFLAAVKGSKVCRLKM